MDHNDMRRPYSCPAQESAQAVSGCLCYYIEEAGLLFTYNLGVTVNVYDATGDTFLVVHSFTLGEQVDYSEFRAACVDYRVWTRTVDALDD